MPLLRPLDPAFPMEHQLGIQASPVILVNLLTLTRPMSRGFLKRGARMRSL